MRVLVVMGTRPEAIKLVPVVRELRKHPECEVRVCATAQHREMLDQALAIFGLVPDFDLDLMRPGQDLPALTGRIIEGMSQVLADWPADWVIVQGDTTTTFATSLAAFYQHRQVAHVEAGLRTGDRYAPWPEEMNRRLTSVLATLHFAPTDSSKANLLREGVPEEQIHVTGNTVIDALLEVARRIDEDAELSREMGERFALLDPSRKLVLVTGHRRESFGPGFENICVALRTLAEREDVQIVYPVHLNPNVQEPVRRIIGGCERVHLIEPQDYVPFVYLMRRSHIIITDSGGIQEEAPSLGKPVLVMRRTTERPEGVEAGCVRLVGTEVESILSGARLLLDDPVEHSRMAHRENPYGDGHAAERIARELLRAGSPRRAAPVG